MHDLIKVWGAVFGLVEKEAFPEVLIKGVEVQVLERGLAQGGNLPEGDPERPDVGFGRENPVEDRLRSHPFHGQLAVG